MTEPMSDEIAVLAEVITAGIPKALSRLEAGQFKRRADSLIRGFIGSLKSKLSPPIPPDVQAAMEVFIDRPTVSSDSKWIEIMHKKQAASDIIAAWAVSHFRKDGA